MNNQPLTRIPNGGVNRAALAHVTDPSNWWTLQNLRPVNGGLEQTPPLIKAVTLDSYFGQVDSSVRLVSLMLQKNGTTRYVVGTSQGIRLVDPSDFTVQTFVPYIAQTKIPKSVETVDTVGCEHSGSVTTTLLEVSGSTFDLGVTTSVVDTTAINRQVLLYGITKVGFGNVGDKFTLTILTATTAQWQFNDSPLYTFTIASNVDVDPVRGLSLAFMATTGFRPGDVWEWTCSVFPLTSDTAAICGICAYNADAYIYGYDRRILRLRDEAVTTVGYNPAYGKTAILYYNHLVVAQYAEGYYNGTTVVDNYDATITPWRLAWSHLNDPDQFFTTDLNEADLYDIPANVQTNDHAQGITGLALLQNVLLIYTANVIFSMTYVGLPNVMQIDVEASEIGSIFYGGLVLTTGGHYFIGQDNFYLYQTPQTKKIGFQVRDQFFSEVGSPTTNPRWHWTYGKHDLENGEIVWTYWMVQNVVRRGVTTQVFQCRQVIYQLDYDRFYFRNLPSSDSSTHDIRSFCKNINSAVYNGTNAAVYGSRVYGGFQSLLVDYKLETTLPVTDLIEDAVGDSGEPVLNGFFTEPYAETPDLVYSDLYSIKEHSALILDASYDNGSGIEVFHAARERTSTTPTLVRLAQRWLPTLKEYMLSFPRISGRVFRYAFKFCGPQSLDSRKPGPTVGAKLNGYVDMIYKGGAEK